MRNVLSFLVLSLLLVAWSASAQFKSTNETKPNVSESLIKPAGSGLWFGFFDPNNLKMQHNFSLSYMNMGGQGMSLGVYTSSLYYKFSDPLDVQFDISIMHTPFGGFGSRDKSDFSGIYLSRARLNYRPSDNMFFQVQFQQIPPMYWMNDPWRSGSFFRLYHQSIREEE